MTESKSFNRVATIILTILVIIAMLPILLIVIASFSAESSLIRNGYTYWPEQWSLDAYYYMVKQSIMILRSYGVSFLVTFVGTALSVIITTMLAYPMSRKSFKYRNALAFFVFFTMLFNGGIVPSYIMWTKFFHIKNTIWALIIPNYLVSAFNVILVKNYYQVDKTTYIGADELCEDVLLGRDMSIEKSGDGPDILIYHTHSQEGYSDSLDTSETETVVGVGDRLESLLREKYGYNVLHHKGQYDVNDRDHAYSNSLPEITEIIEKNPSIKVVIDLHRDGVAETTRLAATIDGKPMAQIMFFNGLCRTAARGPINSLPNEYLGDNLAFSFQLQLMANEYYPGLARRIYLKGYRYNMHLCPKSLLVEVGAQTNTKEEAYNAMEPLADILDKVLK